MHFNFIDVLSLCYGHRHVSATRVAIFRVISLRNKSTVVIKMYLNRLTVLNPISFLVEIHCWILLMHGTWNILTIRLLMSYIYGVPSKARNANVVYIWTYVWQR